MDVFEAILGFMAGVVFCGFFCVLFNVKFKTFCKILLVNVISFIVYLILVSFSVLSFSGLTCFTFGFAGILGFIVPVALMFL